MVGDATELLGASHKRSLCFVRLDLYIDPGSDSAVPPRPVLTSIDAKPTPALSDDAACRRPVS
jgi:hypothetical protein